MVLVSVVMCVYNVEDYIEQCITSVLNQTFKNFEFIIVNDGSTDNTKKIIEKLKLKDSRIKLINNPKNLGIGKSRNITLQHAKGKYISIIDGDDSYLSQKIQKQVAYLEKNEEVFLVASGVFLINEENKVLTKVKQITNPNKLKLKLLKKNTIFHSSVMYRNKDVFYREKLAPAEDYDFYLRLLRENKKIRILNEALVKYRIRKNSASFSKMAIQKLLANKALEFYYEYLKFKTDSYNTFDFSSIYSINITKSTNKIVLECNIKSNFILFNFKKVKKYSKIYFKKYGYFNKFFIYYLASFFPIKLIQFSIKLFPIKILRYLNS